VRLRLHRQAHQRNQHGGEISVDKYELAERYEALGDEDDFLAAKRLFEAELTGQPSALDHRQYGYLLECHGRRTLRRAVDAYEQAMSLDPGQDKVQYQWIHAKGALGEPEDAITRYRNRLAGSPTDGRALRLLASACLVARDYRASEVIDTGLAPGDWKLTSDRGEVKAAGDDTDGALADWHRAHELKRTSARSTPAPSCSNGRAG
jgi:tetratricopeptide (TPR) repeat protein